MKRFVFAAAMMSIATAGLAKDNLGVFENWGAFRDSGAGRCYAIAVPQVGSATRDYQPFATVGTWPRRNVRGQFHARLSRTLSTTPRISLAIGGQRFALIGGGGDAWSADKAMDAAIVAEMRSAGSMSLSATDVRGRRFTDRYSLAGAATALDAASLGCAGMRR